MAVYVCYKLSEAGRKRDVMAGGKGEKFQRVEVDLQATGSDRIVDRAKFTHSNDLELNISASRSGDGIRVEPIEFDDHPTVSQIVEEHDRMEAELKRLAEEKEVETWQQFDEVLRERKVRKTIVYITGGPTWECINPAWPYGSCEKVTGSQEALEWMTELDAANTAAKEAAEAAAKDMLQRAEQEAEAKRIAEEKRREELGLGPDDDDYRIEDGVLMAVPKWSSHKRSRCWMAKIDIDPSSPGGLSRDFFDKARGSGYYRLPTDLKPGDALEVAADYYSASGRKSGDRWYGYVVRITPEMLVVREAAGGKTAVKMGGAFAQK
ncbi:MAG: hypothetical protein WC277_09410 [Bacilli bacterium]|jgi:hypothetical protein